jgi:hypothetical protein
MPSAAARIRQATAFVLGLTACMALAGGAWAAEIGRCYSADVQCAMVLPDDSVHGPGKLRVCVERRISPVTVAHTVSVNGQPVGLYLSRTGTGEERPAGADAVIMFVRNEDDQLVLEGYTRPMQEQLRTYRMLP